ADPAATIHEGFNLLMDRFVRPLDSASLLAAAWEGAQRAAAVATPAPLALTGNRDTDWQVFADAIAALQAHTGLDDATLAAASMQAMVDAVHEGHTYYLTPQRFQEYQDWLHGDVHYSGIGTRVDSTSLVILEVFDGSPAAQAGIRPGDTIVAVDGQAVSGADRASVIDRIRGPSGTQVTVTVSRVGSDQPLDFALTRATIQVDFVHSELLQEGVGYVRLRGFADMSVADSFVAALDDLQRQGATSLVLDLRGNSGGRLDVGARLLSLFIPSGPLYHQLTRTGTLQDMTAQGGYRSPPLPMTVLVDSGTASMGEIFAAAIQDYHRGQVVGTATAGSVAAAQVYRLGDGSGLQVTVMEITSANGRVLNGTGVAPDQIVQPDIDALRQGRDVQLEAATRVLHDQAAATHIVQLALSGAR